MLSPRPTLLAALAVALTAAAAPPPVPAASAADAAQPPAGTAPRPARVADAMAARWAMLQTPAGSFPDSIRLSRGWGRYGEAGLGYGLMLAGLRTANPDWLQAGARAQRYAIAAAQDRSSVFESMLIASGYNLLRLRAPRTPAFAAERGSWEGYLQRVRPLFDPKLDEPYLSSNKFLVEAVLGLELHNSGLTSTVRGTTLSVPGGARQRALHIVNDLVPQRADMLRGSAAGHRITAMSDRFAQPPAYHALATGLLARALDLAGNAAAPRARRALRIAVRTLWAYQAPDGDVAYLGRSQGQSWSLAFAALAADRAAGGGCGEQARDFLAVGDRAMRRLGALHPVGPSGMPIVPSANGPSTIPALDDYAGDVVYNGLTLTGLEWTARAARPRPGCLADAVLSERRASAAILPFETARFAVLRRGRIWMAVKQATQNDDPRSAFGLRALKYLGDDGRWIDLVPAAPRLAGSPATLGPALMRRSRPAALPKGAHLDVRRGRIRLDGGWVTRRGHWVRRGVFTFVPTARGVRIVVPGRRGDTILTTVLLAGTPAVHGRTVASPAAVVRAGGRSRFAVRGPFASTSSLDVWRADLTARPRRGRVAVTIAAR